MTRNSSIGTAIVAAAVTAATVGITSALWPARIAAESRWGAAYFPDVPLITQNGDTVHFYDLIKGKIVAIDLIYTTCEYNCPLETGRLAQVQQLLADRMGRDVFFLSISIDPAHDTPEVLKTYAKGFNAGPGWLFLTGAKDDITLLSKKLGLYSPPRPKNKDGHVPMLLVGNEATGQWIHGSALDNPRYTARMIGDWLNSWQTAKMGRSYAEAVPLQPPDSGRYLYSTLCITCHAVGQGDAIGPDLAGITTVRDPGWLARYIAAPDRMRDEGDPIARALFTRYKDVRMPNLGLTEGEAADIIAYIAAQTASTHGAAGRAHRAMKPEPKTE
jgi:protein SCO1/2